VPGSRNKLAKNWREKMKIKTQIKAGPGGRGTIIWGS
jgi:hypothetical protein